MAIYAQIAPEKPVVSVIATGSSNDYRNLLFNISIVSAEAKDFIEVERAKNPKDLKIRPTLHITQVTPYGELKSTISNLIEEFSQKRGNHPFHDVSGVTAAAIAGSIDEKFRVVPPLNYDFKGGTVVIDEFNPQKNEKASAIGACLGVLEQEKSSRNTARMPDDKWLKKFEKVMKDSEVKNGRLIFRKLRSNWIFLTAKHLEMSRSLQIAMLLSRTVPISFEPSLEELNNIDDNPDLLFTPLNLRVPEFHRIPNSEYKTIRDFVYKEFKNRNIPKNYYFRTVNDCVRCYVFTDYKHDFDLYKFVLSCKIEFVNDYEKLGLNLGSLENASDFLTNSELEGVSN